jgi:hypothetical protein
MQSIDGVWVSIWTYPIALEIPAQSELSSTDHAPPSSVARQRVPDCQETLLQYLLWGGVTDLISLGIGVKCLGSGSAIEWIKAIRSVELRRVLGERPENQPVLQEQFGFGRYISVAAIPLDQFAV